MKQRPGLVANAPNADISHKVIGWAMKVHNDLGPGHREEVYHNALRERLKQDLTFADEPILYVQDELGNVLLELKPDFAVEDKIIVELKAHVQPLNNDELAQVFDYFAASEYSLALLFNFGRPRLEWKRLFPPKLILEHRASRQQTGKRE